MTVEVLCDIWSCQGVRVIRPCDASRIGERLSARVIDHHERREHFKCGGVRPEVPLFEQFQIRDYVRMSRGIERW